jgi:hypothetical protein
MQFLPYQGKVILMLSKKLYHISNKFEIEWNKKFNILIPTFIFDRKVNQIKRLNKSTCKFSKHLFLFDQMLDYKIGICCFSLKHAAVRSKSKDWLARNQNNVWSNMSIYRLLRFYACYSSAHHHDYRSDE